MATVAVNLISSGITIGGGAGIPQGFQQDTVCDVYEVLITLASSDLYPYSKKGVRTSVTYPPYCGLHASPEFDELGVGGSDGPQQILATLTGTPGKAIKYSTATSDALIYDPSPGVGYASLNQQTTSAGDVGAYVGGYTRVTGTTVNVFGFNAAKCDLYIFYVNIATASATGFNPRINGQLMIGVNSNQATAIYGKPCNGFILKLSTDVPDFTSIEHPSVFPSYQTFNADFVYNNVMSPTIDRPPTFSEWSKNQGPYWNTIDVTGGAAIAQTILAPCGKTALMPKAPMQFCYGGEVKTLVIAPTAPFLPYTTSTVYAYYYNVCGKLLNPGGTALPLSDITGAGSGENFSFMYGTFTVPTGAVAVIYTSINSAELPPVERQESNYYDSIVLPDHYATWSGDFLPGMYYRKSITAADMP